MKPRVREVIVVEGRYDKNTLLQAVDAVVVETGGFAVFRNGEKAAYLRRLAEKRGVILMTDPDGARFVIRNQLKGILPPEQVKQAYVPDVYGKERRKKKGGKEGKLGVEGMPPQVLIEALRRAGATFEDIKLFSEHIGESVRMKAAGGIKSFEDAEEFLRLGAKRLGTSRIVKLAKAEKEKLNGNKDTDTDSY